MLEDNYARAIAALAPGRRVTLVVHGKAVALPATAAPPPVPQPDPLVVASKQLLERDAETRAAIASLADRVGESVRAVDSVLGVVSAGQVELAAQVRELSGTLRLPVKPIYDAAGKLIGARRSATLED